MKNTTEKLERDKVVKVLTTQKVDPKRIVASGRAFYLPIAPNDTEKLTNLKIGVQRLFYHPNLMNYII